MVPLSAELHYISRKVANLADNEEELRALGLENAAVCDSHGEGHASLRSVRRPFVGSRKKKGKSQNNNNNNVSFAYFGQCLVTHTFFNISVPHNHILLSPLSELLLPLQPGLRPRRHRLPVRVLRPRPPPPRGPLWQLSQQKSFRSSSRRTAKADDHHNYLSGDALPRLPLCALPPPEPVSLLRQCGVLSPRRHAPPGEHHQRG